MKQDRLQKSEYLFREIGNIHDRWVTEALSYQPKHARVPRVMLIAACIVLSTTLLAATLLIGLHQSAPDKENNAGISQGFDDNTGGNSTDADTSVATFALDTLLLECKATPSESVTVLPAPVAINFFSSKVQVAWQYEDSSAVYLSRALTADELLRLEKNLERSTKASDSLEQPACKVWILYGDGRVVSPYLHPSIGNTGEGELFDYNIEVIPHADFSSCLSEILK